MGKWSWALIAVIAAAGWWWWRKRTAAAAARDAAVANESTPAVVSTLQTKPPAKATVPASPSAPPIGDGKVVPPNVVNGASKPKVATPAKPIGPCPAGMDWKLYAKTGTPYWGCAAKG